MDIKSRLDSLRQKKSAAGNGTESSGRGKDEIKSSATSGDPEHFVKRKVLDTGHQHGRYSPGEISLSFLQEAAFLLNRERGVECEEVLFLDTETTGLAGGAGTCVFLVGLGYFSGKDFVIEQHLMRDFEEEYPLLKSVADRLDERPLPVTFNGKTFDIPLLKSRFTLQRLSFPKLKGHIDLLHPCRRLWNHLPSCSLTELEKELLDFRRGDDISGGEVPRYYRAYLENKDWKLLKPILSHNFFDVISLLGLIEHLERSVRLENGEERSAYELFNLGKQLEKEKKLDKSIRCYEKALAGADSRRLQEKIEERLTWQYKRSEDYQEAQAIWKQMKQENRGGIFPYVELAKFYEHQKKDHSRALKVCMQALKYLKDKRAVISDWKEKKSELQHRRERLEEKTPEGEGRLFQERIK